MKRRSLLLFELLVLSVVMIHAQPAAKSLKKILELKIPREGGANGASVAWHPVLKRYYAPMAGNISYCLGIFDSKGKLLSSHELNTKFDVRGLWYNPNTKTLQMNGYDDFGWGEYLLNSKGFPDTVKILHEGANQPDEQSVGAFHAQMRMVYFFTADGNLDVYDLKDGKYQENIELTLGRTKNEEDETDAALTDNEDVIEDYNASAVITGMAGAEIALLNHSENEIELYNLKDGHLVRKLALPEDAPVNERLNFAYCNGIWWLFDKETRIWNGYK